MTSMKTFFGVTGNLWCAHKGQWRGASKFSLICVWINGWVNNREAGDRRRHRAHYDVIVVQSQKSCGCKQAVIRTQCTIVYFFVNGLFFKFVKFMIFINIDLSKCRINPCLFSIPSCSRIMSCKIINQTVWSLHRSLPLYWIQWSLFMEQLHGFTYPLRWRHNWRDGVSNHQPHDCLLNRLFRRRSMKTSKLRVTGLCVGNSPGTGEFPAQMASYAENVSIWWRHHADLVSEICANQKCESSEFGSASGLNKQNLTRGSLETISLRLGTSWDIWTGLNREWRHTNYEKKSLCFNQNKQYGMIYI